ncbi:unnamed protein product [Gongylonema pulchrum]|uniref:E3 ubiquitin-protein ligase n=1 Tax=Gongylonema pulchrum TaxID=637853 RepID=A0A3P7MNG9_9BILA|nr:unnamed protein product [Gongylonema pulchrum]
MQEDDLMDEAKSLKAVSDELKANGCPLFGGKYCERLPQHIRDKAAELDKRLDSLLSGFPNFKSSIRMKEYDFSLKCNAVWSSDAVAYRCITCAYNPYCFRLAGHEGHDSNRFFSQAGGACDCGNADVLRESGFCYRHGPNARRPPAPSADIVSLNEFIIPKLFVRLFLFFRGWKRNYNLKNEHLSEETFSNQLVHRAHILIELIQELVDYGGPIRDLIIRILLDRGLYHDLTKRTSEDDIRVRFDSRNTDID